MHWERNLVHSQGGTRLQLLVNLVSDSLGPQTVLVHSQGTSNGLYLCQKGGRLSLSMNTISQVSKEHGGLREVALFQHQHIEGPEDMSRRYATLPGAAVNWPEAVGGPVTGGLNCQLTGGACGWPWDGNWGGCIW